MTTRGRFIVFEGLDRSGKSTQAKRLRDYLVQEKSSIKVEIISFPQRETVIGTLIDQYLRSDLSISDEAIHLLHSANCWEFARHIVQKLQEGTTIICDRYAYSGIVYSAAKGLDLDWCKSCEVGLPRPDLVFFLEVPVSLTETRENFGTEKYDHSEFQCSLYENYIELFVGENNWQRVDARGSEERVFDIVLHWYYKFFLDFDTKKEQQKILTLWDSN